MNTSWHSYASYGNGTCTPRIAYTGILCCCTLSINHQSFDLSLSLSLSQQIITIQQQRTKRSTEGDRKRSRKKRHQELFHFLELSDHTPARMISRNFATTRNTQTNQTNATSLLLFFVCCSSRARCCCCCLSRASKRETPPLLSRLSHGIVIATISNTHATTLCSGYSTVG